jgi:hypothetical protein
MVYQAAREKLQRTRMRWDGEAGRAVSGGHGEQESGTWISRMDRMGTQMG